MTWQISDDWNHPLGTWGYYAPWDSTEFCEPGKGFLTTQSHVDIRTFRAINDFVARPQTDLEAQPQSVWDALPQTDMEEKISNTIAEPWVLSGSGLTTLTLGAIAGRGGWPGLQLTTLAGAIDAVLTSSIPADNINISGMNHVSMILPDYNAWDGDSYVQFTSDVNGAFGTGHNSLQVPFSASISGMPHLQFTVAAFNNAGFSNTSITGVKIRLHKAAGAGAGATVTLMAMRGLTNAWEESFLDFDTRAGVLTYPVTLNGAAYGGAVAQNFQYIRGDGSENDPIPVDGAYNIFFYPGGQTSPNDASGGPLNELSFLLRETKDIPDGTGSVIRARLTWDDTSSNFDVRRLDTAAAVQTPTTDHAEAIGGALNPNKHYLFRVEITGTTITGKLYLADYNNNPLDPVWVSQPVTNADLIFRNGRVGFQANLVSRDSYIGEFVSSVTSYATLETVPYTSHTPVDGAQLVVNFAGDQNLFKSFAGPDLAFDPTKTLFGGGSYTASQAIQTNSFIVDDWTNTYLRCNIFVGPAVTTSNQPIILLNKPDHTTQQLRVPRLSANQWNLIEIDLVAFENLITGLGYSLSIEPGTDPDRSLGAFWIDTSINIGRRRVIWGFRAASTSPYREFRALIGEPKGAIHLNPNERGVHPQIQARALTPDAWIAIAGGIKLFPRYAELGNPVYDVAARAS